MKKAFHTILHFGIESAESSHEKRRVKTTNLIHVIMVLFLAIGFTNYFIIKENFPVLPVSTFFFAALLSLYLNKIQKINASFLLFTINLNLSIFFINKYYPFEVSAYLFYFPLIVSVVLLNNPSIRDKKSLLHFSICVIFFVSNLLTDFPDFQLKSLTAEQMKLLWYYNLIMAASVTGLLSFLLTRIIYIQNREIIIQNEDLKKAKEAINASLKEKEVLLAELHHRVKNNLAIISGLLNLQEDATINAEARQIISDSKTRIMSMALVHKMLYENNELKRINMGKYTAELIYELFYSYNLLKKVVLKEDYDQVILPVNKSIPLGLILNEVVTNSIKYAFKNLTTTGVFTISIKLINNNVCVLIRDNGPGFTKDFNSETETLSLGIYLIKTLTGQLDGEVRFSNDHGAKIELSFVHN